MALQSYDCATVFEAIISVAHGSVWESPKRIFALSELGCLLTLNGGLEADIRSKAMLRSKSTPSEAIDIGAPLRRFANTQRSLLLATEPFAL